MKKHGNHFGLQARIAFSFAILSTLLAIFLVGALFLSLRGVLLDSEKNSFQTYLEVAKLNIQSSGLIQTLTTPKTNAENFSNICVELSKLETEINGVQWLELYTILGSASPKSLIQIPASAGECQSNSDSPIDLYLTENHKTVNQPIISSQSNFSDTYTLNGYIPLYDSNGTKIAILKIQYGLPLKALENRYLYLSLFFLGVVILLSAAFGWYIGWKISRPILELQAGAEQIAAGNFHKEFKIERNDEVGQLAKSFNKMTGEMIRSLMSLQAEVMIRKQTEAKLAQSRDELEKRVQERTFELSEINQVSRVISSTLDLPVILQNVVKQSAELVNADAGMMALLKENDTGFNIPITYQLPAEFNRLSDENSFIKLIVEISINSKSALLQEKDIPEAQGHPAVKSIISVPISHSGEHLGSLFLFNFQSGKNFTERELSLIESVGLQAGIAIQNARLFESVQFLAVRDPLTGCFNRRFFYESIQKELDRSTRYQHDLSIILLDIDHFKNINDTYGHLVGDQVLQHLVYLLQLSLRNTDTLGRYGGEEFIIALPETDPQKALRTAERLRVKINENPFNTLSGPVKITISLGIASIEPPQKETLEELISRADQAMYDAKKAGRNQAMVRTLAPKQKNLENEISEK